MSRDPSEKNYFFLIIINVENSSLLHIFLK